MCESAPGCAVHGTVSGWSCTDPSQKLAIVIAYIVEAGEHGYFGDFFCGILKQKAALHDAIAIQIVKRRKSGESLETAAVMFAAEAAPVGEELQCNVLRIVLVDVVDGAGDAVVRTGMVPQMLLRLKADREQMLPEKKKMRHQIQLADFRCCFRKRENLLQFIENTLIAYGICTQAERAFLSVVEKGQEIFFLTGPVLCIEEPGGREDKGTEAAGAAMVGQTVMNPGRRKNHIITLLQMKMLMLRIKFHGSAANPQNFHFRMPVRI